MDELTPGTTLGQYRVAEIVGVGGMATVYRGHHLALDRTVAIKVLPARFLTAPTFVDRFRQEARMVARLRHPNILDVYDFGEGPGGLLYIVNEFMEGGTLAAQLGNPMRPEATVRIVGQIAAGLDYAHSRGIIHRDLKPGNILFTAEGDAVIADFGLAKILEGTGGLTQDGTVLGTPEYMSPEQAMGKPLDGRTDVYSLGVIVYAMLTGSVPFHRESPLATMVAHIHEPLPSLRDRNPTLPDGVEQVLQRAMAKTPDERYGNARELASALAGVFAAMHALPDSGVFAAPSSARVSEAASPAAANSSATPSAAPPLVALTGAMRAPAVERQPAGSLKNRVAAVAIATAAVALVGGAGFLASRQGGGTAAPSEPPPIVAPPQQVETPATLPAFGVGEPTPVVAAEPTAAPELLTSNPVLAAEAEPSAVENASDGGIDVQAADLSAPPAAVEPSIAAPQRPAVQAPPQRPPTATPRPAAPAAAVEQAPAAAEPPAPAPANSGPAVAPMGSSPGQPATSGGAQVAPMGAAPGGEQPAPPVVAPRVEQPRPAGATIAPMGAP